MKPTRSFFAVGALVTALSLTAAPAMAAESSHDSRLVIYDRHTVVNKVKTSNYTNKGQTLGDCLVTRNGTSCTITKTSSATRTIGLALGITRGVASAGLNVSAASSQSIAVSCHSPAMSAGSRFRAWPRGDRFTYKVKKETVVSGAVSYTATSGTLTAFNPQPNSVTCG